MFHDANNEARSLAYPQALSTTAMTTASTIRDPRSLPRSEHSVTTTVPSSVSALPAVQTITEGIDTPPAGWCTVALPAGGRIKFNDTFALDLDDSLSFQAPCDNNTIFQTPPSDPGNSTVITFGDPFYASISPQVYALSAATLLSYVLVIILFITPRTFYVGGPGGSSTSYSGASGFLGRSVPFMSGGNKNSSVIGIGRRPLLQKIAATTVAISLTIATSDTFKVSKRQYIAGFMDSSALVSEVVGSVEIRVIRVISDAFLWLAQVQTLIRLFPRHKEKVTIKWLGFGLVTCDTVFSILENFVTGTTRTRPQSFTDAIPALSYLFELSISLIYASCVIYYCLSKRRFAFWHSKMRNILMLAILALVAVIIPVVFFIVDVAQPDVAVWGEYIRWVGAAAASVVVWEWVERIEALERDEKKDGILGREIFDGDEMLDMTPSENADYRGDGEAGGGTKGNDGRSRSKDGGRKIHFLKQVRDLDFRPTMPNIKRRKKVAPQKPTTTNEKSTTGGNHGTAGGIMPPPQTVTPISRADTSSAASTVYAVRYHNPLSPSPAIPEHAALTTIPAVEEVSKPISDDTTLTPTTTEDQPRPHRNSLFESMRNSGSGRQLWQGVANPFKRKRSEPPAEVAAQIAESNQRRSPADRPFNVRNKLNALSAAYRDRKVGRAQNKTPLQVTVIPAQRRLSRVEELTDITTARQTDVVVTNISHRPITSPAPVTREPDTSAESSPVLSKLPVTVIPAPTRGGRTWSPDDLDNPKPDTQISPVPESSIHNQDATTGGSSSVNNDAIHARMSPERQNSHNNPGIRDSPARSVNSSGARARIGPPPSIQTRDRGTTISSISDRLSTSPAATPTPPPISVGRRSMVGATSPVTTTFQRHSPARSNSSSNRVVVEPSIAGQTLTRAEVFNAPQISSSPAVAVPLSSIPSISSIPAASTQQQQQHNNTKDGQQ